MYITSSFKLNIILHTKNSNPRNGFSLMKSKIIYKLPSMSNQLQVPQMPQLLIDQLAILGWPNMLTWSKKRGIGSYTACERCLTRVFHIGNVWVILIELELNPSAMKLREWWNSVCWMCSNATGRGNSVTHMGRIHGPSILFLRFSKLLMSL